MHHHLRFQGISLMTGSKLLKKKDGTTSCGVRLEELGSHYGALPTHTGLWDNARETSDSLLKRLAIEHMVLEARGLDVAPTSLARFRAGGDRESAGACVHPRFLLFYCLLVKYLRV
eukprot:Rmarinus@m.21328